MNSIKKIKSTQKIKELVWKSFLPALLIGIAFFAQLSIAAPPFPKNCEGVEIPLPRESQQHELNRAFENIPRNVLLQYYFFELQNSKPDAIGMYLGEYLKNTEPHRDWQYFFETANKVAKLHDFHRRQKIESKELCQLIKDIASVQAGAKKK